MNCINSQFSSETLENNCATSIGKTCGEYGINGTFHKAMEQHDTIENIDIVRWSITRMLRDLSNV